MAAGFCHRAHYCAGDFRNPIRDSLVSDARLAGVIFKTRSPAALGTGPLNVLTEDPSHFNHWNNKSFLSARSSKQGPFTSETLGFLRPKY